MPSTNHPFESSKCIGVTWLLEPHHSAADLGLCHFPEEVFDVVGDGADAEDVGVHVGTAILEMENVVQSC